MGELGQASRRLLLNRFSDAMAFTRGHRVAVLAVLVTALLASYGAGLEFALYDRARVAEGEWWRIFTAQFAHLNTNHLLLNLAAWVLVWGYGIPVCNGRRWLWLIVCITFICGLNIHRFETDVMWHGGLSGVLHGIFLAVTLLKLEYDPRDPVAWLGGGALAAKLLWEHFYGATGGTEQIIQLPVLTAAHLHGAIAGLTAWVSMFVFAWAGNRRRLAKRSA